MNLQVVKTPEWWWIPDSQRGMPMRAKPGKILLMTMMNTTTMSIPMTTMGITTINTMIATMNIMMNTIKTFNTKTPMGVTVIAVLTEVRIMMKKTRKKRSTEDRSSRS